MRYLVPIVFLFVGTGTAAGSADGPGSALKNPSFESADPLEGWQLVTYGSEAQVALDDDDAHEGRHALRVSAEEPSDTALGQEVELQPHGWYRFTGWVKTRGLDPMGSSERYLSDPAIGGQRHARGRAEPSRRYRLEPRHAGFSGSA